MLTATPRKIKVNKIRLALAAMAITVLTGCNFSGGKFLDMSHDGQAEGLDTSSAAFQRNNSNDFSNHTDDNSGQSDNVNRQSALQKNNNNNIATSFSKQAVCFLYDSNEIEPAFIPLIEKYSRDLVDNAAHTLVLEGHADERGSREYNIALGEERAKTVAKMMLAQGVLPKQLEIVSYGEEKTASPEHNEAAWHLNRCVNLISPRT